MHKSITNIHPWAIPGGLQLLSARVLGFVPFTRALDLISNTLSTKLSVDAALKHFFCFELIYQLLQLSSENLFQNSGNTLK